MARVLVQECDNDKCRFVGRTRGQFVDALIAPDGTFYEVGVVGHDHAATVHGACSLDQIEREGWVHLSLEYRRLIVNLTVDSSFKVTTAQSNKLFDVLDDLDAQIRADNAEDEKYRESVKEYRLETFGYELSHQRDNLNEYLMNTDNVKD